MHASLPPTHKLIIIMMFYDVMKPKSYLKSNNLWNDDIVMLLGVKTYEVIFLPFHQSSECHFRSVSLVSGAFQTDHRRERLDNLLHLLRPIFIASTYTCRCMYTYSAFSLSSFRGIVGCDGDGFVMRDTSTDESSELISKTRSCASIKLTIFLASRTRRVDHAKWYSMWTLISIRVCGKIHRRTCATTCSSVLSWITDAKIETEKDSRYIVEFTHNKRIIWKKKCLKRLKCELRNGTYKTLMISRKYL